MKKLTKSTNADERIEDLLLSMELDTIEHFDISGLNRSSFYSSFAKCKKKSELKYGRIWIHKLFDTVITIARIK